MQLSPLQLMECVIEGVSIMPVDGFDNAQRDPSVVFALDGMQLQSEAGISALQETAPYSDYRLSFTLSLSTKAEAPTPYNVRVSVVGSVRMHGGGTQDQRQKLVLVNGVSLLCGVVRDLVASVTSRARYGQLLLPTLNFAKLAEAEPNLPRKALAKKIKATPSKARAGSARKKV